MPRDPYILYFGRLVPEKGLETLIEAHAKLKGGPRLVLAGADTVGYGKHLQSLCPSLDPGRIDFVGLKDSDDLARLIDGCLFTVVPSMWPDNCPMSILESFAHRKAVVASKTGGIPEQVTEECGLLFEPGNAGELAEKMDTLVRNPDLRHQMGRSAHERVSEVYAPERHCTELVCRFESLAR